MSSPVLFTSIWKLIMACTAGSSNSHLTQIFYQEALFETKIFRIKLIVMKKDRTAISFYKPLKQRRRENKNKMQTGEERIDRLID